MVVTMLTMHMAMRDLCLGRDTDFHHRNANTQRFTG